MNKPQTTTAQDDTDKLDAFRQALQQARDTIAALVAENTALKQKPAAAVVGMACRFPGGADDLQRFWALLTEQRDAISEVDDSRWIACDYLSADRDAPGKMYTCKAGFLQGDITTFDAAFFGISPKEATALDPQQRLLLEITWHALEDAGIVPSALKGSRTGVFVGMSGDDYARVHRHSGAPHTIDAFSITGTTMSTAAGRIAYTLGLHGPCLTLDTACSSSLVALHLALQSLRRGECDLAIVAGVNLILMPELHVAFSKLQALSPDGACHTFDASANGYVRSEGCAAIVLKRQADAETDQDDIALLIEGCAINQDGKTAGLAAPNGQAQRLVIQAALDDAAASANDIDYVEAHGTGTNLGDPIELEALGAAMGQDRAHNLLVGSVKSNIGHMEPVAGLGGLIKIALSLQHQTLPANLHFNSPNPHVDWAHLPVTVVDKPLAWPKRAKPRMAGLSSFGFSGTNAHVIVAEAQTSSHSAMNNHATHPTGMERGIHVLAISARTDPSLRGLIHAYANQLEQETPNLADVCFSAHTQRETFDQQLVLAAGNTQDMVQALRASLQAPTSHAPIGWARRNDTELTWLFTGQGAQYAGMGATLYQTAPVFKKAIDDCAAVLDGQLDQPLTALLFESDANNRIDQTKNTQPALFALQYALAQLWLSWGIKPSMVVGHSVGEFAAACIAGVLSLPDALRLVSARGRLMQALPSGGTMAAVFAEAKTIDKAIDDLNLRDEVNIACINHPGETVVAGVEGSIQVFLQALCDQHIHSKPLSVSHAFHSHLMAPMLQAFAEVVSGVTPSRPVIPLISNLTGTLVTDEILSAQYWCNHVRDTVRFQDSAQYLLANGRNTLLEIGPHPVLCGHIKACATDVPAPPLTIATLRKGRDEWETIGQAIVALAKAGVQIDASAWDDPYGRRRVKLPHYVFDRKRFWQDQGYRAALKPQASATQVPGLGYQVDWQTWVAETPDGAQRVSSQPGRWLLLTHGSETMSPALLEALTTAQQSVSAVGCAVDPADDVNLLDRIMDPELTGIAFIAGDQSPAEIPNALHTFSALLAQNSERTRPVPIWVIGQRKRSNHLSAYRGALKSIRLDRPMDIGGGVIECVASEMRSVVEILISGTKEDWFCVEEPDSSDTSQQPAHMAVARLKSLPPTQPARPLARQASYLITGGLGGLGLSLARELAAKGVAQVVLLGRKPADVKQQEEIALIEQHGTQVQTLACDLSHPEASHALKNLIDNLQPPLKGVFHLAGVLPTPVTQADSRSVSTDDYTAALGGKLTGAWALHDATLDSALDWFVLFGSISALTGTPGMAAYTAANAGLEQVADERQRLGLPAVCVHWGPWHDGAMIDASRREQTEQSGFRLLPSHVGFEQLWALPQTESPLVVVVDADWSQVSRVFSARCAQPLLTDLAKTAGADESAISTQVDVPVRQPALVQTLQTLAHEQQVDELSRELKRQLISVLSLPPGRDIDPSQGFFDMGMDSLTAFEFREAIQNLTGLTIGTPIIFDYPSIDAMTGYLIGQLQPHVVAGTDTRVAPIQTPPSKARPMDGIDITALSDEDIARLIEQEFDPSDGTGGRT